METSGRKCNKEKIYYLPRNQYSPLFVKHYLNEVGKGANKNISIASTVFGNKNQTILNCGIK